MTKLIAKIDFQKASFEQLTSENVHIISKLGSLSLEMSPDDIREHAGFLPQPFFNALSGAEKKMTPRLLESWLQGCCPQASGFVGLHVDPELIQAPKSCTVPVKGYMASITVRSVD